MKIYINSNYEIKAINSTSDVSLKEIEIDRTLVFGDKSDFMILNYCYKPTNDGYSIHPNKDYNTLEILDNQILNKIDILEAENQRLREVEKEQDKIIMDNIYKMTILEKNMEIM